MTVTPSRRRRLAVGVCFGIPGAVLAASCLWLAIDHGTPLLWNVVVHETGRYTLGGTVLYFDHFLREVPSVVAYALFLLGISGNADLGARMPPERVAQVGGGALVLAVILVLASLLAAVRSTGWGSALQDLLQFRTRDDLSLYGSHWRYHWLSTLWFGAGAAAAPTLVVRILRAPVLRPSPGWMLAAWGWFVGLTLVFGLSADVFTDARYVGHQAREILTHGPVTALMGVGLLLAFTSPRAGTTMAASHPRPTLSRLAVATFLLVPVYLAGVALAGDAMAEGQTGRGLAAMVGAHYFEHTLDYVLTALLLLAGLGLVSPGPRVPANPPS